MATERSHRTHGSSWYQPQLDPPVRATEDATLDSRRRLIAPRNPVGRALHEFRKAIESQ